MLVSAGIPAGAGTLTLGSWGGGAFVRLCLLAPDTQGCCWAEFPTWLLGRSGCRCHSSEAGSHQHFLPRSLEAGEPLNQPGIGRFVFLLRT